MANLDTQGSLQESKVEKRFLKCDAVGGLGKSVTASSSHQIVGRYFSPENLWHTGAVDPYL